MFKPESLSALFSLLQEMTLVQRESDAFRSPGWMRRLEILTISGYVGIAIALLIAAWIQHTWPSQSHAFWLQALYLALILFGMAYMLIAILSVGTLFWRHRRQRFPAQLARLKLDMLDDVGFMTQLLGYDKATLEYALLQYRHRWDSLDGRVGLLVGDLRKLGLFPALTASSMAASTLLKNDSNMYLWMPLILAACFYLVGFYAQGRRERPQQVIDLLDYAARHADVAMECAPEPSRNARCQIDAGHTQQAAENSDPSTNR
ncbi:hypothetical protein [Xanthomonas sontii]|uniref:hypothetical protein n=1 Tax=Xanthomonas sontii TaxID=2650745 RepID=UPI00123E1587|nr:hypothetical protein [Xanthomonas sontii]